MRTPSKFPGLAAIPVGIPRPATSTPFAFSARRNGSAVTEIMRPASPILIGHNPGGRPVMPRVPLVLTGPAGPSIPQIRHTGKISGAGLRACLRTYAAGGRIGMFLGVAACR